MKASLLDSSFLIDLLNEFADGREGPAFAWLERNANTWLWISPVTVAEVLEGADDVEAVKVYLARFVSQGIHLTHAASVAAFQRQSLRRLGENDAWQCAITERMNHARRT